MPARLNSKHSVDAKRPSSVWSFGNSTPGLRHPPTKCVAIGLINNMPDGALGATERQFLSLLDASSGGIQVSLSLYSLPGVPRNELGASRVKKYYSSVEELWDTRLDGLIVTGREPLTPILSDEPYWESFTRTLEWAQDHTYSAVWSCLAAHAVLLHNDGISRVKSKSKHCGVFECVRIADHLLTQGTPSIFKLPHSRWNGIPEDALTSCGYQLLTRSDDAGVDTFIKQNNSLFVFFQGHPEYESDTLLLEYRRDVARYLRGEAAAYPSMPHNYFDQNTASKLAALQDYATSSPSEEVLNEVSGVLSNLQLETTWSATATCIYRNWLEYICTQKQISDRGGNGLVEERRDGASTLIAITAADIASSSAYDSAANQPGNLRRPHAVR